MSIEYYQQAPKPILTDQQKHILIEYIKQLTNPSPLEKDILDTLEEVTKQFINFIDANKRIVYNYEKYKDLFQKVDTLPTTVYKTPDQINEIDLRYILQMQLDFLLEKEREEKSHGKDENGNS